ncbi:MAG: Proton glutamate symport protein [Chlamydiae bacterium]|nr:Proton glutamate symport protein [Chlamydiota bacterium]
MGEPNGENKRESHYEMKLWLQIIIAMIAGMIVGVIMRLTGLDAKLLLPLGTVFLELVRMLVVLLIFASMTLGVTGVHDPKKLGRLGSKTLFFYFCTTIISIFVGIAFATYFEPGVGFSEEMANTPITITEPQSFSEIFVSIVPSNPFAALVSGNALQIIVFSIFLGVAINMSGEKGRPVKEAIESLADVMFQLTGIVMKFAPVGVFGIMAWVTGTLGIESLLKLAKFVLIYYVACILFVGIIFFGILRFIARLDPMKFMKGMWSAIVVAFSTGSSSASLPVSMKCIQENLGVSQNITGFVLPLGSTINMNGTALFQGMAAIFVAQVYDIHLDFYSVLIIVITATLSAVGTAGIPGQGFIMLSVVLTSVGLPYEGLFMLAAVDRLRDMIGTVLNVMGDAVVAVTLAKQEGELDELCYNQGIPELEGSEV